MIIHAVILYLYALSSSSVEPAVRDQTVSQSRHANDQLRSDRTQGKLTSVVWGT